MKQVNIYEQQKNRYYYLCIHSYCVFDNRDYLNCRNYSDFGKAFGFYFFNNFCFICCGIFYYNFKKENKMKILVSACLLGENCKYNGSNNKNQEIIELGEKHKLVPICPECFAGLPIPRVPSEIRDGRVFSKNGKELTEEFKDGAEKALYVAQEAGCQIAILKERSPSCGFGKIYDGSFSGKIIDGNGIAAQLLYENGIRILGESQLNKLKMILEEDEN